MLLSHQRALLCSMHHEVWESHDAGALSAHWEVVHFLAASPTTITHHLRSAEYQSDADSSTHHARVGEQVQSAHLVPSQSIEEVVHVAGDQPHILN